MRNSLPDVLLNSASGRELSAIGFAADVRHAAQLDLYNTAVRLSIDPTTRRPVLAAS